MSSTLMICCLIATVVALVLMVEEDKTVSLVGHLLMIAIAGFSVYVFLGSSDIRKWLWLIIGLGVVWNTIRILRQ